VGADNNIYSDHLQRQFWNVQQDPNLAAEFNKVIRSPDSVELDLEQAFKLQSMGLIYWQNNQAVPSCQLYVQYFIHRLNGG
jgi:hypothetical protein